MKSLPVTCRRPTEKKTSSLGDARRGRFLLLFDAWARKHHTLGHALQQAGLAQRVYYRWRKEQMVPNQATLRRICKNTGFDIDYVLTGIPQKVGDNHLSLCYYQQQHEKATSAVERSRVYARIVVETLLVLQDRYPGVHLGGMLNRFEPAAILHLAIDTLLRFEIHIKPRTSTGMVDFEVYKLIGGAPDLAVFGPCNEASLVIALQYLRDATRKHLKQIKDDDGLARQIKKETAFTNKYNGHYE